MSKPPRNRLGQFRKRIGSSYDAGYDSIVNGPDMENCHFAWFNSPEKTKEWEHGRDNALKLTTPSQEAEKGK